MFYTSLKHEKNTEYKRDRHQLNTLQNLQFKTKCHITGPLSKEYYKKM